MQLQNSVIQGNKLGKIIAKYLLRAITLFILEDLSMYMHARRAAVLIIISMKWNFTS